MPELLILLIAYMLPLLLSMVVMPTVSQMGQRLRLKEQSNSLVEVSTMGGMVVTSVVCATLVAMMPVVSLDKLFPSICMIVCLFVLGMLEDSMKLRSLTKIFIEAVTLLVVIFCGRFRIDNMCGLFGMEQIPYVMSVVWSLLVGMFAFSASRMFNGLDGLLAGVTTYASFVIGVWCYLNGKLDFAVFSMAVSGSELWMYVLGSYSQKYKVYEGHSGALVIGLYLYLSFCVEPVLGRTSHQEVSPYFWSFILAVLSAPLFDVLRVVVTRLLRGRQPFVSDNTHLYFLYTEMGLSEPVTVLLMMLLCIVDSLVWFVTAQLGMIPEVQFLLVFVVSVLLYWVPSFRQMRAKKKNHQLYEEYRRSSVKVSDQFASFVKAMERLVDDKIYFWVKNSDETSDKA